RIRLTADQGEEILLDLPKAVAMADGDGLQLDDGRWLKLQAAPEPVVEIRHQDPHQLVRLAWHLGNRHLPTEIRDQVLRIRPDHVIEDMLRRFDALVLSDPSRHLGLADPAALDEKAAPISRSGFMQRIISA